MDEENQGRREWSGMSHMTEAEAEPEDSNIRTYENAVTLYEDKQYYPDAEDVAQALSPQRVGVQGSGSAGARRRYTEH